jgi:hypothetical protein
MSEFTKRFKPDKVLLVGTGGIDIEVFLRTNPGNLF